MIQHLLSRSHQVKAVAGGGPGVARHAADGVEQCGVDTEVFDEVGTDVEANDLTEDDDAGGVTLTGEDDL